MCALVRSPPLALFLFVCAIPGEIIPVIISTHQRRGKRVGESLTSWVVKENVVVVPCALRVRVTGVLEGTNNNGVDDPGHHLQRPANEQQTRIALPSSSLLCVVDLVVVLLYRMMRMRISSRSHPILLFALVLTMLSVSSRATVFGGVPIFDENGTCWIFSLTFQSEDDVRSIGFNFLFLTSRPY